MRYPLTLFFFLCVAFSFSQKTGFNYQLPEGVSQDDYLPNTIVVKIKKEKQKGAVALSDFDFLTSKLSFQAHNIKQVFPAISKQSSLSKSTKEPTTRLEGIYTLHFDPQEVKITHAIGEILSIKEVEYAEPMYIRHLSYTPNDPQNNQAYHLAQVKAYEAWDIERDASDVIIAIVDSGVELAHTDLKTNLHVNSAETPNNNIDDDNDGYVDNYLGWDFVGSSIQAIIDGPRPIDWSVYDDNDPNATGSDHGTHVAGTAGATSDNGIGFSGVSFNAKIMVLKCGEDAGGSRQTSVLRGYQAIKYAADHGAHIINCSWGGSGYSQFEQEVVNYAAIDKGCLIVAAAGNGGREESHYPSSYDNVYSISNVDQNDIQAGSTSYGYDVDIAAPGVNIYSTVFNSGYGTKTGTSMASPVVSGVAALVKAKYPSYTGIQIGELLRATSDDIDSKNSVFVREKLGKGRVNALRALTETVSSIRAKNITYTDNDDQVIQAGDNIFLSMKFKNYLAPASGVTVKLESKSFYLDVQEGVFNISSLNTSQEISNNSTPFKINVKNDAPDNLRAVFKINYEYPDGKKDWQYIYFTVNQTYLNIINSEISTSLTSNGRFGRLVTGENPQGLGFNYKGLNMLYEMGMILGVSSDRQINAIRGTGNTPNDDFTIVEKIKRDETNALSSFDLVGKMNDNKMTNKLGLDISYRGMNWAEDGDNKYVILEYSLKNTSQSEIKKIHMGFYADWDIITSSDDNTSKNIAGWDQNRRMGYVTHSDAAAPYGAIQVLNASQFSYRAVNNSGFTFDNATKFSSISNLVSNATVGNPNAGVDASHFIGAGPYDIGVGQTEVVAFAVLVGDNLNDLKSVADKASVKYNQTLKATIPVIQDVSICNGQTATLSPTGATSYKWYDAFTGGNLLASSVSFTTPVLSETKTYYVSNADNPYESVRKKVVVNVLPNTKIDIIGDLSICDGQSVTLKAKSADSYVWKRGNTQISAGQSVTVNESGSYTVTLVSGGCTASTQPVVVVKNAKPAKPIVSASSSQFCEGDNISLMTTSIANEYNWSGPNSFISTSKTPNLSNLTYKNAGEYKLIVKNGNCSSDPSLLTIDTKISQPTITLVDDKLKSSQADTYQWYKDGVLIDEASGREREYAPTASGKYKVTVSVNNCKNTSNEVGHTITSLSPSLSQDTNYLIYPNPASSWIYIENEQKKSLNITFYTLHGEQLLSKNTQKEILKLNIEELNTKGVVIVRISDSEKMITRKMIIR